MRRLNLKIFFVFGLLMFFGLVSACGVKTGWPEKIKNDFMLECKEYNAMSGITGKKSEAVCLCSLEKVMDAYKNPNAYDHDLLPRGFVNEKRAECRKENK